MPQTCSNTYKNSLIWGLGQLFGVKFKAWDKHQSFRDELKSRCRLESGIPPGFKFNCRSGLTRQKQLFL